MALRPEEAFWEDEGEKLKSYVGELRDRAELSDIGRDADGDPVAAGLSEDRRAELVQHLRDLGYLGGKEAEAALDPAGGRLWPAYEAFVAEARPWLAAQPAEVKPRATAEDAPPPAAADEAAAGLAASAPGDPGVAQDGERQPSPAALELLRQLTSLDGGFALSGTLRNGERGIPARVAHFRLNALGFLDLPAGRAYDRHSRAAVDALAAFLVEARPGKPKPARRTALNQAGDIRALLKTSAGHPRLATRPLFYRDLRAGAQMQVPLTRLSIEHGRFAGPIRRNGLMPGARFDEVEPLAAAENELGRRFLQAGLWAMGFYEGRVDGIWGPMSHDALMAAVEGRDLEADQVTVAVGAHTLAVNLPYVADHLFGPPGTEAAEAEERQVLEANAPGWLEAGRDKDDEDKAKGGLWGRIVRGFRKAVEAGRRVVVGARNLVRSAVDGIRRGVNWLLRRVQALVAPVRDAIRLAYRSAREAAHTLVRAIKPFVHFVLRKPIVTRDPRGRPFALSHFDLDRDVVHWASSDATPAEVARHARLCRGLARALTFFVTIAGRVVRYVIWAAAGPIGWLRIGLSVITTLAQALSRKASA